MWSENEQQITKITMQVGDVKTEWEVPFTDCTMDDILSGFSGLLIAHTWLPVTVYKSMKSFAEDQMSVLEPLKDKDEE